MARVKIARKKQLQEPDEFLGFTQKVTIWVHENRRRAALIGGGIAAAVLLAIGVKAYVDSSHARRATEVSGAINRYMQAGGAPGADLRQELAAVADRYAGAPEGAVAQFFQAGALVAAGEVDQAKTIYASLAGSDRDGGVVSIQAKVALAYLDLARGAADAALAAFQDLLKIQGTAVPRARILAEIAALHEKQGRAAEARRVYQELIAQHPDGSWVAAAKERLRVLGERGVPAS